MTDRKRQISWACTIKPFNLQLCSQRHLSNIQCLMARTTSLVCFISTVNGCSKKIKRSLGRWVLVVGTKQTLSNLFRRLLISMIVSQCIFRYHPSLIFVSMAGLGVNVIKLFYEQFTNFPNKLEFWDHIHNTSIPS